MERGMETLGPVDAFTAWQAERAAHEERLDALREQYAPMFEGYRDAVERGGRYDNIEALNAVRSILPQVIGDREMAPLELNAFLVEVGDVREDTAREAALYEWDQSIELTIDRKWKVL